MNVVHDPDREEFAFYQAGREARLRYRLQGHEVEFLSTYVPFALRGTGVANALVESGLHWANSKGYRISSRCWYVDKFLT